MSVQTISQLALLLIPLSLIVLGGTTLSATKEKWPGKTPILAVITLALAMITSVVANSLLIEKFEVLEANLKIQKNLVEDLRAPRIIKVGGQCVKYIPAYKRSPNGPEIIPELIEDTKCI